MRADEQKMPDLPVVKECGKKQGCQNERTVL
jgi:hypothetical protein